jgi:hypothetical protein
MGVLRYGPKIYAGANLAPGGVAFNGNQWKVLAGLLGSVGVVARLFQDFNGAGDRQVATFYHNPLGLDLATQNFQSPEFAGIAPWGGTVTNYAPTKTALVGTFTSDLNTVIGTKKVTSTAGTFISSGTLPGHILSMPAATNLSFGSVIVSVDSANQVTIDRNALATATGFTGHSSKIPQGNLQLWRMMWNAIGGVAVLQPYSLPWPDDTMSFSWQGTNGTVDTTGLLLELYPLYDGYDIAARPNNWYQIG